jgi:ABC-type Fe3+/spermidine/putrescine transport system ATPase subunit
MLALRDIDKRYGHGPLVLKNVSWRFEKGAIHALLGPSGCGKSTLLHIIAGIEAPSRGNVFWGESDITRLAPERRHFSLLFQDYALFPHLTVFENIAFGPTERGLDRKKIEEIVRRWLDMLQLAPWREARIWELSGGQQQRVAVARALAAEPQLLMLDEPLSNLDEQLRTELQTVLGAALRAAGVTTLLVTHDQREAFALADRLAIMREGEIVQTGKPEDVYRAPRDAWICRFLGHENVAADHFIPAEAFHFSGPGQAAIVRIRHLGDAYRVDVRHREQTYLVTLGPREWVGLGCPQVGQSIPFGIARERIMFFAAP